MSADAATLIDIGGGVAISPAEISWAEAFDDSEDMVIIHLRDGSAHSRRRADFPEGMDPRFWDYLRGHAHFPEVPK